MNMFNISDTNETLLSAFLNIEFTCTMTCFVFGVLCLLITKLMLKNGHLHINGTAIDKVTLRKLEIRSVVLLMISVLLPIFIRHTGHYQLIYVVLSCLFNILWWVSLFVIVFFNYIVPKKG